MSEDKSWLVVRAKRKQEMTARDQLLRQDFDVYLPLLKSRLRRLGQWFDAVEALFPGYLFINADLSLQAISPIRSTRGVIGVVKFGECLALIPGAVIESLQTMEAAHSDGLHRDPRRAFARGDAIEVTGGRFAGLRGVFNEHDGRRRAIILVDLFSTSSKLSMPLDWLKKCA